MKFYKRFNDLYIYKIDDYNYYLYSPNSKRNSHLHDTILKNILCFDDFGNYIKILFYIIENVSKVTYCFANLYSVYGLSIELVDKNEKELPFFKKACIMPNGIIFYNCVEEHIRSCCLYFPTEKTFTLPKPLIVKRKISFKKKNII